MKKWSPSQFTNFHQVEHDSCGIVAIINKNGEPSHQNILNAVDALIKMEHRSGFINGEGDGCGLLTDIPRALWSDRLKQSDLPANLVYSEDFFVAHLFLPRTEEVQDIQMSIRQSFAAHQATIHVEQEQQVHSDVLGPNGKQDEPVFWQIAGSMQPLNGKSVEQELFELQIEIENKFDVHVASLSSHSCVYKVMGAANILPKYFVDLASPLFESCVSIGHNRYSTNTLSSFFRVQPFSLLGHNGEINTVQQLRQEAQMIGTPLVDGGSDSQDLNRTLETLIQRYDFSLFEAMEMVFPPIINEMKGLQPHLQDLYVDIRQAWGHFAQGPAGIVSRYKDECVFSIDSLGLRPLWMVETETSVYFSSEQGLVSAQEMLAEPKSLAPGEKVGIQIRQGMIVVYHHHQLQEEVYRRYTARKSIDNAHNMLTTPVLPTTTDVEADIAPTDQWYSAFGWDRDHIQLAEQMALNGADPVRSLGHDGPLAALSQERQNIADYLKESVAVVTNPAIDREREMEHFSTRTVLGQRSSIVKENDHGKRLELYSPLLIEGKVGEATAPKLNTLSYEQVLAYFEGHVHVLHTTFTDQQESLSTALERLQQEAVAAISNNNAQLLVLDDRKAHREGQLWIDPHLVVSAIDQHLVQSKDEQGISLRRKASLILRSASIRSLHDIAVACGLGANAVNPYLLFATVSSAESTEGAAHLFSALNKGLEKVTSTIGIHELRGYNRIFSAIGLRDELAQVLNVVNFCGSEQVGLGFTQLEEDSRKRVEDFAGDKARAGRTFRIFPRVWKPIGQIASGTLEYSEYAEKLEEVEKENPISIRHVTDLNLEKAKQEQASLTPEDVSIRVGEHDLPFVISSMSFGSQNETAYRAYAEAADQLNMISINGEGGEIKDMLGKYPNTRGLQVASGRFGVNIELANSAKLLEIKIGQGAKPGEGGHLPGSKVTAKIAAARNATIGSDLISPSNNHDIYSIEDLAQIITELKTANNEAKVIVKVPIVPNIGTIAVGIAKAGADVVSLSGFDGGTGAARIHALQHVGLPVELGVKLAHNALIEAGLRDQVEVWGDGGIKSALDALKIMLLGANRIGFGTLSMIAVGCTTCRGCHLDTCHVGIATQIDSMEEAQEKGLKRFVPREMQLAISGLKNMFTAFGQELQRLTASLGFQKTQDLVGRSDLLQQVRELEKLDLTALLAPAQEAQAQVKKLQKLEVQAEAQLAMAAGAENQMSANPYVSFDQPLVQSFSSVLADQRVLGSRYAGERVKNRLDGSYSTLPNVQLHFEAGSGHGNGLAAFNVDGIHIRVQGGAQDGVGKTSFGGVTSILKAKNNVGQYINGSVGKGFCYGAQKGLFIVQGNADSRAGIRLSGADVIIGGEITAPLQDELGGIGARANIKGFAFEYMTNGRALVMGDPGPWICSGMTGGVVYLRLVPEMGLDENAIRRRIAKAAKVNLEPLSEKGKHDVQELLTAYIEELLATGQQEKAEEILQLKHTCTENFVQLVPTKQQADPSVSTE